MWQLGGFYACRRRIAKIGHELPDATGCFMAMKMFDNWPKPAY
jgi:hypothetical protein